MDQIPLRNQYLASYRQVTKKFEQRLPKLPFSANSITAAMLVISAIFPIFAHAKPISIIILLIILILDFLDGVASRQQKTDSKSGYLIDTASDKISDFLCAIAYIDTLIGKIFMGLVFLNVLLQFVSIKYKIHYILAVRFFILVYLLIY